VVIQAGIGEVNACFAGQSGSFALKRVRRKEVRKGMVVLKKLDDD
jgi:GTPase